MYSCRQYNKAGEINGNPFFKMTVSDPELRSISFKCNRFEFYFHLDSIVINGNTSWTTMEDFFHDCHLDRENKHAIAIEQALLF